LLDTLAKYVVTWGFAESHSESMAEVTDTQTGDGGQISGTYRVLEVGLDVVYQPPGLPAGQLAPPSHVQRLKMMHSEPASSMMIASVAHTQAG